MDCGRRLVTDNVYNRQKMAKLLLLLTDGEAKMFGTMRKNVVDAVNRPALTKELKV